MNSFTFIKLLTTTMWCTCPLPFQQTTYLASEKCIGNPFVVLMFCSLLRYQGDVNEGVASFRHYAEIFHLMMLICAKYCVAIDKLWLEKLMLLCRNHPHWTLAHFAACLKFNEAFKEEQVVIRINEADEDTGSTPLHVAVQVGGIDTVRTILALSQTLVNVVDAAGNSVLHLAVTGNSLEILEILLDIDPKEVDTTTTHDSSDHKPMGFKNSVKPDVNAINAAGETCLYLATKSDSFAIVETLLRAGADPTIGTTDRLPIHLAVEKNSQAFVELLCNHYPDVINLQTRDDKLSVLHISRKMPIFPYLLKLGADVNLTNSCGRTVLHDAVQEQNLDTVMQLLTHAADANIADNNGVFPLHLAASICQDVHIVYALIAFEADPNATDADGLSVRHWLCRHKSTVYQQSPARDTILFALDVVRARRCPPGLADCTSGCVSAASVLQPQEVQQQRRSSSFSYFSQILRDMSFTSLLTDTDPTAKLFNGTPPDPILSNPNLTHDLETDLFLHLATTNLTPFKSSSSSRRSGDRAVDKSDPIPRKAGEGDTTDFEVPEALDSGNEPHDRDIPEITEASSQTPSGRPVGTASMHKLATRDSLQPTPTNPNPQPWYRRPLVPRLLSTASSRTPLKANAAPVASSAVASPAAAQRISRNRSKLECSGRNSSVPCCLEGNAQRSPLRPSERSLADKTSARNNVVDNSPPYRAPQAPPEVSKSDEIHRDPEGFRIGNRGYRVLCLDGGGIRGLILCQILRAIERAAGKPIRDLFDWVIGTSTGAMLALNIVQGKCVQHNRCLYFRLKEKVFTGSRPYPTEGLEVLLREEFGDQSMMTDLPDVRVSVTALRGDHFPPRLHMFRNYPAPYERMEQLVSELVEERSLSRSPKPISPSILSDAAVADTAQIVNENPMATDVPYNRLLAAFLKDLFGEKIREVGKDSEEESDLLESIIALLSSFSRRYMCSSKGFEKPVPITEQPIWQAARASGAAPSYFRACGPYLDGGMIANNPTLDILTEAQELSIVRRLRREPNIPIASVTSLGTGRIPLREVQQLDVFLPQKVSDAYKVAMGVTELSRMLVEMATMSEGRVVERSRAWCSSMGIPFFRFSPMLSENVSLDTKDTRTILQMLWETEAYLCNCHDRIDRLAESLLTEFPYSSSSETN
uniref:phospholipase A2 n=1 Tax=Mesocestoides corti TaxID=53468 RepID=A0A5K3F0T9_MESCO